jgi:hypothetical protein
MTATATATRTPRMNVVENDWPAEAKLCLSMLRELLGASSGFSCSLITKSSASLASPPPIGASPGTGGGRPSPW